MYTLKRFFLFIFIILLFISIYQDITTEVDTNKQESEMITPGSSGNYSIAHVKVVPGDTVLSIIEDMNKSNLEQLNMKLAIEHFEALNPTTDPLNLKPHTVYYFPVYNQ
ncbi:hypothetical protein [Oceanobacillus massiliensis]|uniref:hypothetical protein n=1 Tax=Oceanobacillus massiliensis TaxID=1465765 RepID=UPI000289D094|nr:hypothetical protein [Oceanobacillus massiliensis]